MEEEDNDDEFVVMAEGRIMEEIVEMAEMVGAATEAGEGLDVAEAPAMGLRETRGV